VRDAEAREDRRGPTLHAYALGWLDRYAGSGHDSVRENTRREYRRLLVTFALAYFDREVRVAELDRVRTRQFVDWLTTRPGRHGRLRDRSIADVITPLRLALDAAVGEGLLDVNPFDAAVLPRRRAGRSAARSSRASSVHPSLATASDSCRCPTISPRPSTRYGQPTRRTTRPPSPVARAGRRTPVRCVGACSLPQPDGRARRALGFTRCATRAPRC
jgi:hypothetical protein